MTTNMILLIISMIALAVFILAAISGVLSGGLNGLKKKGKLITIVFAIYAIFFLLFLITQ